MKRVFLILRNNYYGQQLLAKLIKFASIKGNYDHPVLMKKVGGIKVILNVKLHLSIRLKHPHSYYR